MKTKTKTAKTKPTKTTTEPQVQAQPEPAKVEQPASDKPEIAIRVPINGRVFHAKSEFSLEVWKAAKTEPSAAQFIIGTLLNAMRTQGYAD